MSTLSSWSGSMLIAVEQCGRMARLVELDLLIAIPSSDALNV